MYRVVRRCLPSPPQSFVDSMVVFVNRRVGALVEVLSPKDAACAFARRLRQHVQAHDATTAALGIRAGRKKVSEGDTNCNDTSTGEGLVGGEGSAAAGGGHGELEEHDVQASILCALPVAPQETCNRFHNVQQ